MHGEGILKGQDHACKGRGEGEKAFQKSKRKSMPASGINVISSESLLRILRTFSLLAGCSVRPIKLKSTTKLSPLHVEFAVRAALSTQRKYPIHFQQSWLLPPPFFLPSSKQLRLCSHLPFLGKQPIHSSDDIVESLNDEQQVACQPSELF
jgi:hypothetical protein